MFELHVFRARNRADADVIAKLLYRRVKLLRSYDFYGAVEEGEKQSQPDRRKPVLFGGYYYGEGGIYGDTPYVAANSMVYVKGYYIFLLVTPDNRDCDRLDRTKCGRQLLLKTGISASNMFSASL